MAPDQEESKAGAVGPQETSRADEKLDGDDGRTSSKRGIIGLKEIQRWGAAIRQRRRDLGLTLKQLADLTGISFGYLAKLERGDPDAKNPTRIVIDALRGALNLPAPGGEQLSRTALASWGTGEAPSAKANADLSTSADGALPKANFSSQQRWRIAEVLLLICGRLSAAQLAAGLDCGLFEVEETIQTLRQQLAGHGIVVQEMNGEYQLASDAALGPVLRLALTAIGLAPRRPMQLTQAQREVLALVIMHQPITRAAIERYRGVDSEKPLHALLEAELVAALPMTAPNGARQYISTLRVLEESGYSSLEALHQAISKDILALMAEPPEHAGR